MEKIFVTDESFLTESILDIGYNIGVDIPKDRIEACHRVGKNGERTIIKFSSRKDARKVLVNKKKLKSINLSKIGLTGKIYINESLCSYYKKLWYLCKKLWINKHIASFWTSNGAVRLRVTDEGKVNLISHEEDLSDLFPDLDIDALVV